MDRLTLVKQYEIYKDDKYVDKIRAASVRKNILDPEEIKSKIESIKEDSKTRLTTLSASINDTKGWSDKAIFIKEITNISDMFLNLSNLISESQNYFDFLDETYEYAVMQHNKLQDRENRKAQEIAYSYKEKDPDGIRIKERSVAEWVSKN